ncbi:hypothetical protein G3R49_16150 [Shewanella sp. WXL01]|uniref:Phage shock protein B n=1 Tax=Shewanella maritima TaxID=2520507 RepID=A0A411PHU9_9GAMM|nr:MULTISPECIES: hypothetical protein [Shewanella]NKF52097.1 hypothetical protein [Shewanella sp. WXL01]QBF83113.1 hypothetical protein EXU30_10715 [Shewanella maritima]
MENDIAIITLVALIVMGTTATELFKYYMKAKYPKGKLAGQAAEASSKQDAQFSSHVADLQAQNQALKERVQVLEKLVTDEGFEVKQQINRL